MRALRLLMSISILITVATAGATAQEVPRTAAWLQAPAEWRPDASGCGETGFRHSRAEELLNDAVYLPRQRCGKGSKIIRATVFGQDDRRMMRRAERKKYSGVGLILSKSGRHGATAFVSRSRDLVTTVAHVFLTGGGRQHDVSDYAFHIEEASYNRGIFTAYEIDSLVLGTKSPAEHPERDWAILKLKKPVSADVEPFQVSRTAHIDHSGSILKLIAYHGDKPGRISFKSECGYYEIGLPKHNSRHGKLFFHGCDMRPGASGGPMIAHETGRLVGMQVGHKDLPNGAHFAPYFAFNYGLKFDDDYLEALERLGSSPSVSFVDRPETDLPGGDIGVLRNITLDTCRSACMDDPACKAFTFNASANQCFLKDTGYGSARHEDAVSGEKLAN